MNKKKLFHWISSTILPIVAAFGCEILFDYSHNDKTLLILVGSLLFLANLSLLFHALETRNFGPFAFCLFSSGLILTGKFLYFSNWHISVGIFGLFLSAVLNLFQNSD